MVSAEQEVQDTTEVEGFRGTVSPYCPAIDEISAIYLVERLQKSPLNEIEFCGSPECSPEQTDAFISQGYFPIEIGDMNYHAAKVGSATEAVAENIGHSGENRTAGEKKLFAILAEENLTGYLKHYPMSVVWMVQELYHLPHYTALDLVDRTKDVVHFFVTDIDRRATGNLPSRDDGSLETEFPDLVGIMKECQFAPFTVGRYLRDMWRVGEPTDQIREKITFWTTAWDRFQEEYGKAKNEEWPKIGKIKFSLDNGLAGTAIETANRFVSKIGVRTVGILINRNPNTGHAVFMSSKLNLSALKKELDRLEPKRWYYHQSAGNLINGGPSYPGVTPTGFSLEELVGLVQKFPPK